MDRKGVNQIKVFVLVKISHQLIWCCSVKACL